MAELPVEENQPADEADQSFVPPLTQSNTSDEAVVPETNDSIDDEGVAGPTPTVPADLPPLPDSDSENDDSWDEPDDGLFNYNGDDGFEPDDSAEHSIERVLSHATADGTDPTCPMKGKDYYQVKWDNVSDPDATTWAPIEKIPASLVQD